MLSSNCRRGALLLVEEGLRVSRCESAVEALAVKFGCCGVGVARRRRRGVAAARGWCVRGARGGGALPRCNSSASCVAIAVNAAAHAAIAARAWLQLVEVTAKLVRRVNVFAGTAADGGAAVKRLVWWSLAQTEAAKAETPFFIQTPRTRRKELLYG